MIKQGLAVCAELCRQQWLLDGRPWCSGVGGHKNVQVLHEHFSKHDWQYSQNWLYNSPGHGIFSPSTTIVISCAALWVLHGICGITQSPHLCCHDVRAAFSLLPLPVSDTGIGGVERWDNIFLGKRLSFCTQQHGWTMEPIHYRN